MRVTLVRESVTSQQTFDSYIAELTALALRLVNDLATSRAFGQPTGPVGDAADINAVLAGHDSGSRHPLWTPLSPPDATALVAAVRRLRTAVDACIDGDIGTAAGILNALLAEHHAVPNLHGEPPVLAFHPVSAGPLEARVADMSTSLAMIIGTGRTDRLGRCTATDCDRVFYDTTRNASRRFCGLTCQNRAKASAYRARKAATSASASPGV